MLTDGPGSLMNLKSEAGASGLQVCSSYVGWTLGVQAGQATVSKLQLQLHETSAAECVPFLLPAPQLFLADSESVGKREKLPGLAQLEGGLSKVFNS